MMPARAANGSGTLRWHSWSAWSLAAFAFATALALASWAVEAHHEPVCALKQFTGVDCPTCGMTRSFTALAHGDWDESLGVHPLGLPLALEALGMWLLWGMGLARDRPILSGRVLVRAAVLTAGVFLGVWLARMAGAMG